MTERKVLSMSRAAGIGESSQFKVADARSYDPHVASFDHFTERFSAPLADRVVELACLTASDRVLDVGTGTGVVALRAADRVAPRGSVTAVDLSNCMLSVAGGKNALRPPEIQVRFCAMDAELLAVAAGSFDAVLSLFALMHFPNPLAALREMHRVLRPGGRLVIAVGSGPPLFSLTGVLHRLTRVPDLVKSMQGKQLTAPHFLNALVEKHVPRVNESEETALARGHRGSRGSAVHALVQQAGFVTVRSSWQGYIRVLESPQAFWDLQATFSTLARKRLAAATPEQAAAVRAEFFDTCRKVHDGGGRLIFPQAAVFVVARRG